MNKLPVFASNKKCWRIINNLVFGEHLACPDCQRSLKPNYKSKYLWCGHCRKKYRATAYKGSWLYDMKLKPAQLFILSWCWQNRKSPDTTRLLAHVSYTTVCRGTAALGISCQSRLPLCWNKSLPVMSRTSVSLGASKTRSSWPWLLPWITNCAGRL